MQRKVVVYALTLLSGLFLLGQISPVKGQEEEIQRVLVTNFPPLQQVAGTVSVEGPVRHATLQRVKEILVPPVEPKEISRLIDGGVVTADGFTSAVLSLNGQAKGKILRSGTVGAILIPEEETVIRAFEDEGQAQFPLEVSASISSGASRSFASTPVRLTVAFPRYRVRLYNTSDKTVTVDLFAYLTN
jgi:hypothetical protein